MKQHTNKILLIVLLALVSAFVLTKVFRSPALESNLESDVFHVDTGSIATIKLEPKGNEDNGLILKKNDSTWAVQKADKVANVETSALNDLLRTLGSIKPERIVSRRKEKWNDYQVSDTSAFRVVVYDRDMDEVSDWRIGKQAQGVTYIRAKNENEVYALEGSLRNRFDKNFNDWRDKTFLRLKKTSITKIIFKCPADSGFAIEKNGQAWMINDQKADSAKVENFLANLESKDLRGFADKFSPSRDPDFTLLLEGTSAPQAVVKAWKDSGDKWFLTSNFQNDVYFSDAVVGVELFPGKESFLKRPGL